MTNTKDIIEDIFIAYKLSFSLEELLSDKSILVAYELSQALNGSIKVDLIHNNLKLTKGTLNKGSNSKTLVWLLIIIKQ